MGERTLIAATALVLSLGIAGTREWPARHFARVAVVASVIGIGYTVFSEWMNVHVHNTWAYSQLMPVISLKCLADKELFSKIVQTREIAHDKFQVDPTPTFFINGKRLKGDHQMKDFEVAFGDAPAPAPADADKAKTEGPTPPPPAPPSGQ